MEWAMHGDGDFDIVLSRNERSREQYSRCCADEFKENMGRLDLLDLLLTGEIKEAHRFVRGLIGSW